MTQTCSPYLGIRAALAAIALLSLASMAVAQPLCAAPSPLDVYYTSCKPGARDQVARFLYDLSVRHLLLSEGTVDVPALTFLKLLGLDRFFDPELNPEAHAGLEARDIISFRPLDRYSGEVLSTAESGATLNAVDDRVGLKLEVNIPVSVQGLYWRSPGHLEVKFYKGHEIAFRLRSNDGSELADRISCLSINGMEARAQTHDPEARHLLIGFEKCPER
jgi:hypothetical protein